MHAIPQWLESDPSTHPRPPATARLQELPYGELSWGDFERLCLRLARASSDIEGCRIYGTAGQSQGGIDFYARKKLDEKYTVYQCKREDNFGPAKISGAVDVFLKGNWADRTNLLVLCTKEDLRAVQRSEEIERQRAILNASAIDFSIWDAFELNLQLKDRARIVDDFFGRAWVEAFCCIEDLEKVKNRIDGPGATKIRADLKNLYSITFKADDPGLPINVHDQRNLPIEERYVVPDVLPTEEKYVVPDLLSTRQSVPEFSQREASSAESKGESDSPNRHNAQLIQDRRGGHRQPVDEWLKDKLRSVVLAGPGLGKSTLLRFLALDILSDSPRFGALSVMHRNRLPVWVPFGFWTTLISDDTAVGQSIEDVVQRWIHHLACDALWPSLKKAIADERLLLLVDGLDEYRSESAAGIALRQLQVFVELRRCPAILTSRPLGFQRLPTFTGEWDIGNLAEFTEEQQRNFVSIWTRFRHSSSDASSSDGDISQRVVAEVERFEAEIQRSPGLRELGRTPLLLGILVYLNNSNLPLPQNRFQAYRRMVDHLIVDHPRSRKRAASVATNYESGLALEDFRKILWALAFRISVTNPEGVIERSEALKAVREFLSDTELGFGYGANVARQTAERVIVDGETSLGLIVERAPGLCAFVHRAFQEHLCATHLASLSLDEQLQELEARSADPQWRDVILGVTHLNTRPVDVREIVTRLDRSSTDPVARFGVEAILCEIAVGPFSCPADICLDLCHRFIRDVETGPWISQRIALLRLLLGGIRSPKIREVVRHRLYNWYPCRSGYRHDLYSVLVQISEGELIRDALFRALHDEEPHNQGRRRCRRPSPAWHPNTLNLPSV